MEGLRGDQHLPPPVGRRAPSHGPGEGPPQGRQHQRHSHQVPPREACQPPTQRPLPQQPLPPSRVSSPMLPACCSAPACVQQDHGWSSWCLSPPYASSRLELGGLASWLLACLPGSSSQRRENGLEPPKVGAKGHGGDRFAQCCEQTLNESPASNANSATTCQHNNLPRFASANQNWPLVPNRVHRSTRLFNADKAPASNANSLIREC